MISREKPKMTSEFSTVIEKVKKLSSEEKEELRFLIDKYLTEERRTEYYRDYRKSLKEFSENKLQFSGDIDTLKEMI